MLSSVHIENIALINKLDIDFSDGFTVFTGETGAGKSILIDSINMVSGARMTKDIIRTGAERCTVGAVFSDISEGAVKKLSEYGIDVDEDDSLMVQRTMNIDGKSVCKINGRTVSQSMLKSVCSELINIYGQHEFYSLTDPTVHIEYVDSFANCDDLKRQYGERYNKLCEIREKIRSLKMNESEKMQRTDFLRFQVNEISSAKLRVGEEEKLNEEKTQILNYEKISSAAQKAYLLLYGSDKRNAYTCLNTAIEYIDELTDIIPSLKTDSEKLNDYVYEIRDIAEKVLACKPDLNDDPTVILDNIEGRLDVIYRLKKKYNLTVEGILAHLERIESELRDTEDSAESIKRLEAEYAEEKKVISETAAELTSKRKAAAEVLEKEIKEQFAFLDMPDVIFKTDFRVPHDAVDGFLPNGADEVEFLISTNKGEPLKPLSLIHI